MSDELDTADGASTGAVTPRRPTGKRSRRRALDDTAGDTGAATAAVAVIDDDAADTAAGKAKAPAKKKADKGAARNPFAFVLNYLKQVVAELRKVIWPNRKQMIGYTTVVLVFLVFMVALIGGVDLGLAKLVMWVFG